MLTIAIRAARKAGQIISRGFERADSLRLTAKGRHDYATEIDIEAEQHIIAILRKAYPSHAILAEESGTHGRDDCTWLIDPLDGTANFMRALPHFAVSIGLQVKDQIEQAVIYDPIRDELFTASRGSGAALNDRRLRINTRRTLEGALLSVDLPQQHNGQPTQLLPLWVDLQQHIADMRHMGSAALDLAYIAASRLDGFCESGLKPWDLAAGTLLVQEAGGLLSDFQGKNKFLNSGDIVAGNQKIYASLRHTLEKHQFVLPE